MEKVTLTTLDGIDIIGDLYKANEQKFAILLHMMPATKESWEPFIRKLLHAGYTCLAIDERGHGESTMGGTLLYKEFESEEQQAKKYDVEAAFKYLQGLGATEENTVTIGASIGANLAINFLKDHPETQVAVALSPGIDYHGVMTDLPIQTIEAHQKAVVVASEEDIASWKTIQILHELNPEQVIKFEFQDLGHGTAITDERPQTVDEIIALLP